jgi:ferrochelatase
MAYDALLVVSFGGPESREEVLPFLENVLRGRNVPRERLLEVAEHYYHFDGKSPIHQHIRDLIAALGAELESHGMNLPIYWGNRNWHPMLGDAVRQMKQDGIEHALAFVASAYSSYSGCRQYREDIAKAQAEVGVGAPAIDKIRVFYNHPGFIAAWQERMASALDQLENSVRGNLQVVYTAHSIPVSMASGCDYVEQLEEVRRLLSHALGIRNDALAYQSRSGPSTQPWLAPDVLEHLRNVKEGGLASGVVLAPIGFLSDHMEVLYDLDQEARQLCDSLSLPMVRAKTLETHPRFVRMIRELIEERTASGPRLALGMLGARRDVCAENCCPPPLADPRQP